VVQSRTIERYLPTNARQEDAQTVFLAHSNGIPCSENKPLKGLSDTLAAILLARTEPALMGMGIKNFLD
jgi:hypothetical protein